MMSGRKKEKEREHACNRDRTRVSEKRERERGEISEANTDVAAFIVFKRARKLSFIILLQIHAFYGKRGLLQAKRLVNFGRYNSSFL